MADAKAHALVTPDDVIDAMGQNPELMASATSAFESAIARAKLKLKVVLGTEFAPLSCVDTFMINGNVRSLNRRYTLRLTNGILRGTPTVSWCTEVDGTYEPVINPIIDHRRGIVQVPEADDCAEWYVKVAYDCGLKVGDTVPESIKQGLICLVPMLMLSSAAATSDPKTYKTEHAKAHTLETFSEDMVQDYTRRAGACAKPIEHTATVLQV